MSVLGYSLDRFDADRPGPFFNSGTYPHRFTAGAAKILSKVSISCKIVSVLVDTKDANTTLNIYEGTNSSGALIASIVLSKLGTIPMFFSTSKGVYISCMGGAGSAVVVTDAASYNSAILTVSGNELSDATRSANTQGDGRTPPDSSYAIWETTTNLVANGGLEGGSAGYTAVSSTFSQDSTWFKFGSKSGKVITGNAAANEGAYITFVASGNVAHTESFWAKGASGTVRARIADNAGVTITAGAATNLAAGGVKVSVTSSALTNGTTYRAYIETDVQQNITYWFDGVQVEAKSYPTPYVETSGATASRSTMRIQAPTSLFSSTQGWFAMCFRSEISNTDIGNKPSGEAHLFNLMDAGGRSVTANLTGGGSLLLTRDQGSGSSSVSQAVTGGTINRGDTIVAVVAWTGTTINVSANGANFSSQASTPAAFTALTSADIGGVGTGRELDGDIFWAAYGTGALANADAATINGFGATDHLLTDFPGNPTFLWPADTSRYYTP